MHNLSAYLMQAELQGTALETRFRAVDDEITAWLSEEKSVDDPQASQGSFKSQTGDGRGEFSRSLIETNIGRHIEVRLSETAGSGQRFSTTLHVVQDSSSVSIYATLAVTSVVSIVTSVEINPRCPAVVRKLLARFGDWKFSGQPVPASQPIDVQGDASARLLCDEIRSTKRMLPMLVISTEEHGPAWPDLAKWLAHDLIGLASVALVDEEGSWAITEELGKESSCYLGAVRLYWPITQESEDGMRFRGRVWTRRRLESFGEDSAGMNRFLLAARRTVMSAAAITVVPPPLIREFRVIELRKRLQRLRDSAKDDQLNSIIEENTDLTRQLEVANTEIAQLQYRIFDLKDKLGQKKDKTLDDQDSADGSAPPRENEIRFYKKYYSKGPYDILAPASDCGHNAWQAAHKAEKAKKGIEKLEGRAEWKGIQHCGTCTGGGMWKVRW